MDEISESLRHFILESFQNMGQLRIFLRLNSDKERVVSVSSLSAILSMPRAEVENGLINLKNAGLIIEVSEPECGFRYNPISPGLTDFAEKVVRLDREMPVTLLKLVANRTVEPLKAFADSFRLR